LLAGVLDLEGTDEGSFFAAEEGDALLEAVARSGAVGEMTPFGLFSSAWGLAVLLFNALAAGWLVLLAALAVLDVSGVAAELGLLAGLVGAGLLAEVLAEVLAGVLAAVWATDLSADLPGFDLAAGIQIPQGHKQMGSAAALKTRQSSKPGAVFKNATVKWQTQLGLNHQRNPVVQGLMASVGRSFGVQPLRGGWLSNRRGPRVSGKPVPEVLLSRLPSRALDYTHEPV